MGPDSHRRKVNDKSANDHATSHRVLMKLLVPFVQTSDHNFLYENFLEEVARRLLTKSRDIRAARQQAAFDDAVPIAKAA